MNQTSVVYTHSFWTTLLNSKACSQSVVNSVKNPPAMQETWVLSLDWEDPLEEGLATHSSTLAWRIPWSEEPDKLQSVGSQNIRHD